MMKHIFLYTLILSLVLLSSCTKKSDESAPTVVDKSLNLKGTGDSARDILSNERYTKLVIEIGYVAGYKPTNEAIDSFLGFLKTYTFKENIEVIYNELPSPDKESLTLEEIADLESENRTAYTTGETLAIYIYFSDAPADDDDEEEDLVTLGAVFRNTSMIIHQSTVRKLAGQSFYITNAAVESATINHEFGHLFGLVDLGTEEVNPHEDAESENHCNVEGCLMRAELQFGGVSSKKQWNAAKATSVNGITSGCSLSGKTVLSLLSSKASKGATSTVPLGAECTLDLQANGGR